jgi:hypothetical protein
MIDGGDCRRDKGEGVCRREMKGTVVRSPSRRLLPSLALRATPLLSTLTLGSATIASDLRARLRCAPLRKRSGHATEGE